MLARILAIGLTVVVWPLIGLAQAPSTEAAKKCEAAPIISFADAQSRVVVKGPVHYPPLANQLRLEGAVLVEVCVAESGEVVDARTISGHPILVSAAVESAKMWKFQPSSEGPFKTVLPITFSRGSTKAEFEAANKINNRYFAAEEKCRDSLRSQKYGDAVKRCRAAVEIVEQLASERSNERMSAYGLLGQALVGQGKFEDAAESFSKELEIGKATLSEDQAELAYAYYHVALAFHALGRASDAAGNYARAEQALVLARDKITLEELKPRYEETLKQIRENYLLLLQQTGQKADAMALEKRLSSSQ